MKVKWNRFDYNNKQETAPPGGDLVWIYETYYHGVFIGYYDGQAMRTSGGSDDCHVTHWAEIEWPEAPEGTQTEEEGQDGTED